ncbi:hypothetical protein VTG60DRAFT_1490 [Thermothelomyces hinnuleus]
MHILTSEQDAAGLEARVQADLGAGAGAADLGVEDLEQAPPVGVARVHVGAALEQGREGDLAAEPGRQE